MARNSATKANILVDIHERITRQCLLSLLEFAVTESRPVDTPSEAWTLDHFLNDNLPKLTSTTTGNKNIKLLLPGFGVRVNSSSWPLYLISFIIVEILGDNVVPAEIKEKVRRMARCRAELYNKFGSVSDDLYDNHVQELRIMMEDICKYLQRTDLCSSIESDIENIVQGNIPHDPRNIKVFQDHQGMEKSYRDNIKHFTPEEESLHTRMEQVISILEQRHLDDLTTAQQGGHDLTQKSLPPREEQYPQSLINTMPVVIELVMTGCGNQEQRGRLIRELINIINNKENPAGYQPLLQDKESVRKAFEEVFSGIGEFIAKSGCVQIIVRPKNIVHFFRLLRACVKGILTEEMKPIQDIIRKLPGCEHYEQEAVLYRDHYTCVMDNLVSQLTAIVQKKGLTFPKRITTKPMLACGKLIMKVGCFTEEDQSQFERCVNNGKLRKLFNPINKLLQYVGKDVAMDLMIHYADEKTSCQPVEIIARCDGILETLKLKDVHVKMADDSSTPSITGFAVVPPYIIGVDYKNNCIKCFDIETKADIGTPIRTCNKPTCKPDCHMCKPWDVAMIDEKNNHVVVSVPASGKLIFVRINENQLIQYNELVGHEHCRGLAYADNQLYIGYEYPTRQIKVIKLDGNEVRVFSDVRFHSPWYMAFDEQSKSLYISEVMNSKVYQLNECGNIVKIMKLNKLIETQRGIALKDSSTLYIVGHGLKKKEDFAKEVDIISGKCHALLRFQDAPPKCVRRYEDFAYEVDIISGKCHALLRFQDAPPKCVRRYRDSMFLSFYGAERIMQFDISDKPS
ncbi:hypothetical protein DPMN_022424 [Dreissena polymorpha]|uniref:Uncharacterized protein n=2 Tax=Dreissena polymorpha TaxID=45954 RepID=A0A9D4NKC2_DREPO|nr:hypothetical protein DPMN_022424 [Dreissena polymorpha]